MTSTEADGVLARRAARGDHHAFGILVRRHSPALAQAGRSFGIPETDIDDVVQDTFVAAWRALGDYDEARPFRAWLFHIGLNKMRDLRRFRRVRHFLFGAEDLTDPERPALADPDPGPERRASARRELARVVAVLDGLDANSREAIVLTAIVGMSQPEAAAALGMTPKAIEGRIGRARAKLAALIDARSTE
ncbi:MAG: sigma-70 family RNA polymerase sigma factor [Ralstonia sp.]|uniref:RNA polymerase sigma factor n=1 Tax=Ralstonia pickettii TaxID=329 RepID=A0AAW4Q8C3_RALPI|nr:MULTISPECIES: sigma-70 family RNA polymerase sigma factor [Ralstonia]NOZ99164.1 sigma-70 family RNA polymerase sigma factor [Betaproteobacteria bacterium]NPT52930.1 sigma-70 family RNA polymerase sigma factor [Ralstonia sp. 3N]AJW47594.1 RNA polymerase sigma factor [Ralstonia mannitolilytica]MBA4202245.1 sigma-70 family RNA polymerase sigma factor [Ralstonia sp.]MBA4232896.1 sigma-70 family RNA polymerase sigma factor [Ralstonia sp.]